MIKTFSPSSLNSVTVGLNATVWAVGWGSYGYESAVARCIGTSCTLSRDYAGYAKLRRAWADDKGLAWAVGDGGTIIRLTP